MENLIKQISKEINWNIKAISNVTIEGHFASFTLNNSPKLCTIDLDKSKKRIKKNSYRLFWF